MAHAPRRESAERRQALITVYLWEAGSLSGVTDDEERARRAAAECIRSGQAVIARVEKALALPGIYTLVFDYHRTGTGWIAQRRGGRISWVPLRSAAS